jgi:phosphohistidine swiveling domain-containing protein
VYAAREGCGAMARRYVFDLQGTRLPKRIGSKAARLRWLSKRGFRTPPAFVCTWDAYARYLKDHPEIIDIVRAELLHKLDLERRYAVRSSANVEDDPTHSFAGQFKSVLDVQGMDEILQAIWSIWASTQSPGVQSYLEKKGLDPATLKMAIVVQEMVSPVVSGVSFSKNPVTGLDEIVVEAVTGSGRNLVQSGVTPNRWVHKWGEWVVRPEPEEIDSAVVEEVVQQTKRIARARGHAVDLEWVYDGRDVFWLQVREITTGSVDLYSNRISREFFPGIIKPLVWSINVPLVNGAWVDLFTELIGPNDIDPLRLAKCFYYRAYFNLGAVGRVFELLGLPQETLELLAGIEAGGPERPTFKPSARTVSLLPRMLRAALDKLRLDRKVDDFLPAMWEAVRALPVDRVDSMSEQQLLVEIDRLHELNRRIVYFNIVVPLLMQAYNVVLRGQLRRLGVDLERFDPTGGAEDLRSFDPNAHLLELNRQYNELDDELRARIREGTYDQFRRLSGIDALQAGVEQFVGRFGHLSDSGNDFSSVPWRETPELVLQMIADYTPPEERGGARLQPADVATSPLRRPLLRWICRRAGRYRYYREAVGSLYTLGYGLFRVYFLALGERFVERGILALPGDIFYLEFDRVRGIVEAAEPGTDWQAVVAGRKREIEETRGVGLPTLIYGDQPIPLEARVGDDLTGTPASRGRYTGPARVVRGIRDFGKLVPGDVLVIPYSDVGWTPLFTRAGAVVAESGGILSHSSIVAREYGIPAVVSVLGACELEDGTLVTVDGYQGLVIVHRSGSSDAAPAGEGEMEDTA